MRMQFVIEVDGGARQGLWSYVLSVEEKICLRTFHAAEMLKNQIRKTIYDYQQRGWELICISIHGPCMNQNVAANSAMMSMIYFFFSKQLNVLAKPSYK